MTTEIISDRQWDHMVGRAFKSAVRRDGIAHSRATITNLCHNCIVEVRPDEKTMIVRKGWREALKAAAVAESISSAVKMATQPGGIYRCPDNADHDEHYQGITDKPGKCPVCGVEKEYLPLRR